MPNESDHSLFSIVNSSQLVSFGGGSFDNDSMNCNPTLQLTHILLLRIEENWYCVKTKASDWRVCQISHLPFGQRIDIVRKCVMSIAPGCLNHVTFSLNLKG